MTDQIASNVLPTIGQFFKQQFHSAELAQISSASGLSSLPHYLVDAMQRSVLFIDLMRRRGNQQLETAAQALTTVLRFEQELLMDGKLLPRPINYALSRILPPKGIVLDPGKRPVVVIDPRAGQASGIGGFKSDSEIGDALHAGHTVYFIGFSALPEPGQQFLDVVEGQVKFFERVVELHPDADRPFAIGNCQAGYQTLMVAMLRPDLFGPCLIPGSPMSYWQGERGKNPMRYSGRLLGGSWLNEMTSDLGKGKVDGTGLVLNFDNLNPAYWLWGKQYEVYANIDSGAERYLEFKKWWGDFIQLNGEELQFLVDNLLANPFNQPVGHWTSLVDIRQSFIESFCARFTTITPRVYVNTDAFSVHWEIFNHLFPPSKTINFWMTAVRAN